MRSIVVTPLKIVGYMLLGAGIAALSGGIWLLQSRPDLDLWHTIELDEEFTADADITTFSEYLQLEERLFAQLETDIYQRVDPDNRSRTLRYRPDGAANPRRWSRDWNRSFVLEAREPRATALLLHGMSDSPYSLRAIGESLHRNGVTVVGMRLPGHGTAPTGLRGITADDLAAAAELGVRHASGLAADRPVYVVGYSMGGALAVDYALRKLDDESQPELAGIVLVSPAIGVTAAAQFAVWQARVGYLLGLPKLEWNSITLEYDPFKYGSFAVNAGDVVYRLTQRINAGIDRARSMQALERLPPILAFQSIVDATVSTPALIDGLMANLPARGDELVVFDIDRTEGAEILMARNPSDDIQTAMGDGDLPFSISVVTNRLTGTNEVEVVHQAERSAVRTATPLHSEWPEDVVSLTHVALPIPPTDELYGNVAYRNPDRLHLGNLSLRGERGLLLIPASDQLRMRWNPFFNYLERRILEFMELIEIEVSGPGSEHR